MKNSTLIDMPDLGFDLPSQMLPDPDEVSYYALEKKRKLYLDFDVGYDVLAIQRRILRWNLEDAENGVPVEQRKPIWLYVADVDDYAAHSRALCVNPLDSPYWCARTPEALDALIRRTTPEAAAANCRDVLDFYGAHETGNAAVAAAAYICSKLDMN